MKMLKLIIVTLALVLPVMGHGGEAKPPVAPLPKGHPPVVVVQDVAPIRGKVLKTMESGGYTYIQLQQEGGNKIWVAVPKARIAVGKRVSLEPGEEFRNFKSKTLNRTFDKIIFSLGPIAQKEKQGVGKEAMATPGSKGAMVAAKQMKVERAAGPDAHSVAEIFAHKENLAGKKVVVRGKVVKVSPRVMKKNWVHIQDGTGSLNKKDHDLVVTTKALPDVGGIITVNGILLKDKDFGSGYKYDVLIDNAEIVAEAPKHAVKK